MSQRQRTGREGEELAVAFLSAHQAQVFERNWRPRAGEGGPRGEIDVVARDGEFLVFVEVKTRSSNRLGRPGEAVTPAKQFQLTRLAHAFLGAHPDLLDEPARFDVIEVWLKSGQKPRLHWIKNAFDARE